MKIEEPYKFYFTLHVALVFVYFIYNAIEVIVEGTVQKTIMGIVFLTILVTRFAKPYGRLFIFFGFTTMLMNVFVYTQGELESEIGLAGVMFENVWLVVMGCSGHLINVYGPKKCCDCGGLVAGRLRDNGWNEYKIQLGKKSKNLEVCDNCLSNEFWTKLTDLKENDEHYLPFKNLDKLRKTNWFFPSLDFGAAGVFMVFGLDDMAMLFFGLGIFAFVMNKNYSHKKSDFKAEGSE